MTVNTCDFISQVCVCPGECLYVALIDAGAAYKCLRCPPDGASQNDEEMRWSALADRWLVPVADQLLTHVARFVSLSVNGS